LLLYRANYPGACTTNYENVPVELMIRWKTSIHMPRWASRITLELPAFGSSGKSISDEEARQGLSNYGKVETLPTGLDAAPAKRQRAFATLWDSIYGFGEWDEILGLGDQV
jgi:hypothetical protein